MDFRLYVHVVDNDFGRRARIAHDLYSMALHAEIYQDLGELIGRSPAGGTVLVADDGASDPEVAMTAIGSLPGSIPVAFFSANPSRQQIVSALLAGASDYLEWPCPPDALQMSIVKLQWQAEQRFKFETRKSDAHRGVKALSPRQRQVLDGLMIGETNKDIAARLRISARTVEIHRGKMMTCLSAHSVSDAVRIGMYAGIEGASHV